MSTEIELSIADALAHTAALESQLGQAHATALLAQADAETLRVMNEASLKSYCGRCGGCHRCIRELPILAAAHPGQALADEVAAARAARWTCQSCGAEFPRRRNDGDTRLCSQCVKIDVLIKALRKIEGHDVGAYTTEEGAGANVESCEWCGDMRDIAARALALVQAGAP